MIAMSIQVYPNNGPSQQFNDPDDFFRWLITEGIYDDIVVQKRFSVPAEVMKRLKGGAVR